MSRWWESERSRTASSVRATRRRLRASYKASLAREVTHLRAKSEKELQVHIARLNGEASRLQELLAVICAVRTDHQRDDIGQVFHASFRLGREVLMRCERRGLVMSLADQIGKACRDGVIERFDKETRQEAQYKLVGIKDALSWEHQP